MTQHFLKSSIKRNFAPLKVGKMSENEAFRLFVDFRWGGFDSIVCPHCWCIGKHYFKPMRKQWNCKDCHARFSVTTNTKFQDHKMTFSQMIFGIAEFVTSPNSISFHALASKIGVTIKTAQAFVGKLREGLFDDQDSGQLSGLIHVDGGHFGGRPRSERVRTRTPFQIQQAAIEKITTGKTKRKGRTKKNWIRMLNRRVIMVGREVSPEKGKGGIRTKIFICMSENEKDAMDIARKYFQPDSVIMSDENPAYNQYSTLFDHKTVVHAVEFATVDGVSDNQAESYFSRMRRFVIGVSHRITPKYMLDSALEIAWREDVRRITDFDKAKWILRAALKHGLSRWWRCYWQGHSRGYELLWQTAEKELNSR